VENAEVGWYTSDHGVIPGLGVLAIKLRIRIFTVISAIFLVALAFHLLRSHLLLMPEVA
jgi:hypothetical protein